MIYTSNKQTKKHGATTPVLVMQLIDRYNLVDTLVLTDNFPLVAVINHSCKF